MGGQPLLDLPFEDVADVAARRVRGPDTGERRLARALLADVLVTLREPETLTWIADDVDEYPAALPLSWVAEQLGVPHPALRRALLALAAGTTVFRHRQRGIEVVEQLVVAITAPKEGTHAATG